MQCRSHSPRCTSECLWRPAARTNTPKRREQKTIQLYAVVYLKPKQLIIKSAFDVLYWSYTYTKHRAASLRQQSFLFLHVLIPLVIQLMFICHQCGMSKVCLETTATTGTATDAKRLEVLRIVCNPVGMLLLLSSFVCVKQWLKHISCLWIVLYRLRFLLATASLGRFAASRRASSMCSWLHCCKSVCTASAIWTTKHTLCSEKSIHFCFLA